MKSVDNPAFPGRPDAIIFDLDGTLRFSDPDPNHAVYDAAVRLGAIDGVERRRAATRWAHSYWASSQELIQDVQRFPNQGIDFWTNYTKRKLHAFGCSPEQAGNLAPKISAYMDEHYNPQDIVPDGTAEVLHTLQTRGYTLGLLTNRREPVGAYLESLGLGRYFTYIAASGELGYWKPNPAVFQAVLERMQLEPHCAVYVGDNYYADIEGARAAGMGAILLDPEENFDGQYKPVIQQLSELLDWFV